MVGARLVMTDMVSPAPQTLAGRELETNMQVLLRMRCTQTWPLQGVSAFQVPTDLKTGTTVFLAGSPANHDPENKRMEGESYANKVEFKQEIFYSLCWNTPADSAVALTYSASACEGIEWWSVNEAYPPRVMLVASLVQDGPTAAGTSRYARRTRRRGRHNVSALHARVVRAPAYLARRPAGRVGDLRRVAR
jgi:hypothetical protein